MLNNKVHEMSIAKNDVGRRLARLCDSWPFSICRVSANETSNGNNGRDERNCSKVSDISQSEKLDGIESFSHSNHISIQMKLADEDSKEILQMPLGTSSVFRTTVNLLGIMLGLGLLSTPYALEEGGWMSLGVLFALALICSYTAFALAGCLDCDPKVLNYQDIGNQAFGMKGRLVVSTFLYVEIIFIAIGYTISLGDNVAAIFVDTQLNVSSWLHLTTPRFLTIIAVLFVLPTLWVRDLRSISFLSFGGVITSLLLMLALTWAGIFDAVGFRQEVPFINMQRMPVSTGLYAFCYAGHVVFPTIYRSMKDPSKFGRVILISFVIVTAVYSGFACLGATMFGSLVRSQITLNMPKHLLITKLALWATVITPMSKYALQLSPVARELENIVASAWKPRGRMVARACIVSFLLLSILAMALALPYFGYVLSLTGSFLSITMSIILPCVFYIKIKRKSISVWMILLNSFLILIGLVLGISGTIASAKNLIESIHGHARN
ncbi:hypothetical protein SUGI_0018360 [Cryptomeria japonica]|uniref:amino acid transporter AVT1H n=1 Tax=Cryptomeria japonica TaxID=3369 RepID=UPI002408A43D|nr:amino acid transporter AVT1H [Cryptomeria japonica]GLJ05447.1 hypothetical protein SUGI_0018360 [Cryptomeria japonica]